MRGHVHQRGSSWTWVADDASDPLTGRRTQRTKGGFRTRADAQKALRAFLAELDKNMVVDLSQTTVTKYLQEWLQNSEPSLRPTTYAGYCRDVDKITKRLGSLRLQDLTALQIESMYADLAAGGGRNGQGLSPKSIQNVHGVLRRALGDAERLGLVSRNAARLARAPRVERVEIQTWSADQVLQFLKHVEDDRLSALYILLATTGVRRGEALGLRWSDVDIDQRRLGIVQSLTTVNDRPIIGPVKTSRSRRRVSLDSQTVDALVCHRQRQYEEFLLVGWQSSGDDQLVFCNEDGSLLHPERFTRVFKRHVASSGLPTLRGPHGLRHTWATLALQAGIHPKVVSDRLGHSTVNITLDTYSHVVPSLDADAADLVAERIYGAS